MQRNTTLNGIMMLMFCFARYVWTYNECQHVAHVAKTDDNVKKFFGSLDDFLVTSLASQHESLKFISEGSTNRKTLLAKFLDLEIFDVKDKIAKEESSLLEGKIKHLEGRSEDYEQEIEEAQEEILRCVSCVDEQEKVCQVITDDVNRISRDMMKIETRLESTPIQKVIDVDEAKETIRSSKSDITALNKRNAELQEGIDTNEVIIQKIDDFVETFNYTSWKDKKQQIVDLKAEITEVSASLSSLERDKHNLYEKKNLLQQVPCGSEFSHCKFIRSAYEKLEGEPELEKKLSSTRDNHRSLLIKVEELEPDTVDKYLSQYDEILEKRKDKKGEITSLELEIAKNKTTIVKLREVLNKSEEDLRLFEENEKVIREFAALTKERNSLVKQKSKRSRELELCKKEIASLQRDQVNAENILERLNEDLAELQISRRDYSAYDLYRKSMGQNGVSLDIIKRELPSINQEIAKILANVVEFEVYLENDGKWLNVMIKHPKFEPRPLEMGSGAEKSIAAMAIRLAFINVSSLPIGDIFILDEPGTALDEENMEGFIRILDMVKSQFKNVILISHLESLKDSVDLQISIEKKGKFAFVNQ